MNKFLIIHVIFGLLFFSCGEDKKKINESSAAENQVLDDAGLPLPNVTFFQYGDSSSYPDAILELYTPLGNQVFKPGKVPFEFNVKNFDLQKSGGESRLFMILNGGDPIGYLAPIFQRELTVGTYRAVAYLVDEEGLCKGLPYNRWASGMSMRDIVGDVAYVPKKLVKKVLG